MAASLNYIFAQEYLKEIVLQEKEFLLQVLFTGRENFERFIESFWLTTAETVGKVEEVGDFENIYVNSFEYQEDCFLLTIDLPFNKINGECIRIAFNFSFEDKTKINYYTYEYINSKYYLCQWTTINNHKIISSYSTYDPKVFEGEILNLIKTKKDEFYF